MNALEIIEQVRAHNADLIIDGERLLVQGRGERLPEDLRRSLRAHKAELMVALGSSMHMSVASVLGELRPNLPPNLRALPDHKLLVLVNSAIIAAWAKTLREVRLDA